MGNTFDEIVFKMWEKIKRGELENGMYELTDVQHITSGEYVHSFFPKPIQPYCQNELDWFMTEDPVLTPEMEKVKIWRDIASTKTRRVNSNYGYRILKQMRKLRLEFVKGRRGILMYADRDISNHCDDDIHAKSDMLCTLCTCIKLRGNTLIYTVYQRSNDMCYGTIYNYRWHIHCIRILRGWLKSKGIKLTHERLVWNVSSLHVYRGTEKVFYKRYIENKFKGEKWSNEYAR